MQFVQVENVVQGVYIPVGGHIARIAEVKRLGDWCSLELHTDQDDPASTLILPNKLQIEILIP